VTTWRRGGGINAVAPLKGCAGESIVAVETASREGRDWTFAPSPDILPFAKTTTADTC